MDRFEIESLSERVMQDGGISLPLRLPGGRHIRWVMRVPHLCEPAEYRPDVP